MCALQQLIVVTTSSVTSIWPPNELPMLGAPFPQASTIFRGALDVEASLQVCACRCVVLDQTVASRVVLFT